MIGYWEWSACLGLLFSGMLCDSVVLFLVVCINVMTVAVGVYGLKVVT